MPKKQAYEIFNRSGTFCFCPRNLKSIPTLHAFGQTYVAGLIMFRNLIPISFHLLLEVDDIFT